MAAGIVGEDGVRHAMAAQFKRGQRSALVARAGFIHPDMQRDAGVMRQIDRRQGGAVIHRRQPAGIAMGEDVDGLAGLLCSDLPDDFQAMLADGHRHRHIFVGDGGGFGPGQLRALVARLVEQRVPHAIQRPAQIDGGGPGLSQHVVNAGEIFVGGIAAHRQRQAIGAHRADQGAPRVCMVEMAWAASSADRSMRVTNSCGSLVWSMMPKASSPMGQTER